MIFTQTDKTCDDHFKTDDEVYDDCLECDNVVSGQIYCLVCHMADFAAIYCLVILIHRLVNLYICLVNKIEIFSPE